MKEVKKERLFTATVLSNKMDKTAVVLLERKVKHPKYKKVMLRSYFIKFLFIFKLLR